MADGKRVTGHFVGRRDQLQVLDDALDRAQSGVASLVVVSGEAGIGKTRFCREVTGRAERRGFAVGWGACWADGGAPPLWPWQRILRALGVEATAAALDDDAGGPTVDPRRFALFVAVGDGLTAKCHESPVLVVLDDVHVAGTGAVLLARFTSRLRTDLPLLLLLTRRSGAEIPAWNPEAEGVSVVLERFDPTESAAFLGPDVVDGDLLLRLTGGHPLHLGRALSRGGGARSEIVRAVRELTPVACQVLSRAALLGPGPSLRETAVVCDAPPDAVHAAFGEASSLGLVSRNDSLEQIAFSHELVRQVLQERLTVAERLEAHARAAHALAHIRAPDPSRSARHALRAAARSPEDARYAVAASRAAARELLRRSAYEEARILLAEAVDAHERAGLAEPVGPLLVEWAESVLRCGRLAEARTLFDRAASVAGDDPITAARAALGLGGLWVNEHRSRMEHERVVGLQRNALAALPTGERHLRQRLTVRLAADAVYQGGSLHAMLEALDGARELGDGSVLAEALSLCHHAMLTPRYTRARLLLAEELITVASRTGEALLALVGLCWRTVDLFQLADPRATRSLAEFHERAAALNCLGLRYIADAMDVMVLIREGRLAEAETAALACHQLGKEVGDADALGFLGAHLITIRWLQGRDAEMLGMVEEIAESVTLNPAEFGFAAARAGLAARAGHPDEARVHLDRLIERGLGALPESSTWLAGMHALCEAADALGDAGTARQLYDLLVQYRELPIMPSLAVTCLGSVERALGVAALTFGEPQLAVQHLERAVTANRLLGHRPVTAVSRADLARAVMSCPCPDRRRAQALLEDASREASALDMPERGMAWSRLAQELSHTDATIRRRPRQWVLSVGDRQAVVPDRVGVRYLTTLLVNPGRPVPAVQLAADDAQPRLARPVPQPVLDEHARQAYRRRAEELMRELDDAVEPARIQRLRAELDALLDELRRGTGMGGRSRHFPDAGERARTAVQKAIRRAVDDIAAAEPYIGAMLRTTVTTGTACLYTPDLAGAVTWTYVEER